MSTIRDLVADGSAGRPVDLPQQAALVELFSHSLSRAVVDLIQPIAAACTWRVTSIGHQVARSSRPSSGSLKKSSNRSCAFRIVSTRSRIIGRGGVPRVDPSSST